MLIINFHNVLPCESDPFDRAMGTRLDVERFRSLVEWLSARFFCISLDQCIERLRDHQQEPDERFVTLTFDDGYRGVMRHAFPILQEMGIPASVFVITQALQPDRPLFHFEEVELAFRLTRVKDLNLNFLKPGKRSLENAKERASCFKMIKQDLKLLPETERQRCQRQLLERLEVLPEDCYKAARSDERFETMDLEDLFALRDAGWTIGSHTRSHRTLNRLSDVEVSEEITGSRDDLRSLLGLDEMPFAYPYGRPHHIGELAQGTAQAAGYSCALTMIKEQNNASADAFEMHRVDVRDFLDKHKCDNDDAKIAKQRTNA
jgi:peptidoglycan/xylan/chitin deacetylase (PgdA/CDA1 family)